LYEYETWLLEKSADLKTVLWPKKSKRDIIKGFGTKLSRIHAKLLPQRLQGDENSHD